jgi:hypothetical protein
MTPQKTLLQDAIIQFLTTPLGSYKVGGRFTELFPADAATSLLIPFAKAAPDASAGSKTASELGDIVGALQRISFEGKPVGVTFGQPTAADRVIIGDLESVLDTFKLIANEDTPEHREMSQLANDMRAAYRSSIAKVLPARAIGV